MSANTPYKSPAINNTSGVWSTLKSENRLGIAVMLVGSVLVSLIMIVTDGNAMLGAGFIAVLAVVLVTFYRLDWGLFIFLASFLVFDNVAVFGFDTWTYKAMYMATLNVAFPSLAVGGFTPMEIHMIFLILVWILLLATRRNLHYQHTPLQIPATIFSLWLLVMTTYGIASGGDPLKAVWDVRAMFYLVVMCFLVPQIITTNKQIRIAMWICIGSLAFKALQAAIRFIGNGFSMGGFRALAPNEDPILMVPLFVLLVGMVIFGSRSSQRNTMWILLPTFIMGFYAANRRAAYISLLICGLAFVVLLTPEIRRRAIKIIIPASLLFALYLAVFWNSPSAELAQAVKSAMVRDPSKIRREDYTSGLARDQENYNLAVTFRRLPFGLGFGKKHDFAIENWGNFILRGYITHNQILWLLIKSGPVGFFLFLFLLNTALFYGASIFSKLRDPYLMAVCASCIIVVLDQIIISYVDMGLTRFRCTAYLGLLLGLFPAIQRADMESQPAK